MIYRESIEISYFSTGIAAGALGVARLCCRVSVMELSPMATFVPLSSSGL